MQSVTIKIFRLVILAALLQCVNLHAINWEKSAAVAPAVVSIRTQLAEEYSTAEDFSSEDGLCNIYQPEPVSFLERILQKAPPLPQNTRSGYGFFISSNGYILTSYSTVKDAQKITVTLSGNLRTENVVLVGYDAKSNLALLKIDGENYTYLTLDGSEGKVGDWVVGLGKTEAGEIASRFGVISHYPDSPSQAISFETLIQSDLPKCEMTGDPLLDTEGRLLGVNVISDTSPVLSIPSQIAQEVVRRLMGR